MTTSAIVQELVRNVESACMCGLESSQIINAMLQCYSDPMALTFRAIVLGNAQLNSQALLRSIQQWVENGDHSITVSGAAVTVNADCPVPIQSYVEESCDIVIPPSSTPLPPTSSSNSASASPASSASSSPASSASANPAPIPAISTSIPVSSTSTSVSPTPTPPTRPKQGGDGSNSAAIAAPVVIIILLILIGVALIIALVVLLVRRRKESKSQEYLMFSQDNGGEGEVHLAADTYQPVEGKDFNNPIYGVAEDSLDAKPSQEPGEVSKGTATENI